LLRRDRFPIGYPISVAAVVSICAEFHRAEGEAAPELPNTQGLGAQYYLIEDQTDTASLARSVRHAMERKIMEETVFAAEDRAQVALDCVDDGVICTDLQGNITSINLTAERMMGCSREWASGRPIVEVLHILDDTQCDSVMTPRVLAAFESPSARKQSQYTLILKDGSAVPIKETAAPTHDRDGHTSGSVRVFRDMSEARGSAMKIVHSAGHDFLTDLPNRMLLNDRVDKAIAVARRYMQYVAVLFLDLDGFKYINDSLGHPMGDKLLQSIAKRLTGCVGSDDTVSRQGGDEFVVLLGRMRQPEVAAITASRLLRAVARTHSIAQHDLHVTTSIGISVYPNDGLDAQTLIQHADTAMYHAKEYRRQGYQFFNSGMNAKAVERHYIEESLRGALERQELAVHYQPKIDLLTGIITGAEALIRWTHPSRGPISPGQFIPIAEECGLILPIGNWVLRQACQQARAWIEAGLRPATVAVNVSAVQFQDENFLNGLLTILSDTGLDPSCLELELTETCLMKRVESTVAILRILRGRGVRVSLDDFGTGYSSLSYLRTLPIDAIKIDQSFVRQISTPNHVASIVTAMISMGRSLKLRIIAEGVETRQELKFLRSLQCDEAQGNYFSRPVPAPDFAMLLKNGITNRAEFDAVAGSMLVCTETKG
jgi:diguanylate cyclase (GGDEF)-like protein/PAS domain S-box-containing protein